MSPTGTLCATWKESEWVRAMAAAAGLMGEQGADLVGRRSPTAAAFHGSCCIIVASISSSSSLAKRGDPRTDLSKRRGKRSGGSRLVAGTSDSAGDI